MMDPLYYMSVQMHRMNNTVNYGLRVMVMRQCKFISGNTGTVVVGDVGHRGRSACMEAVGWTGTLWTLHVTFL